MKKSKESILDCNSEVELLSGNLSMKQGALPVYSEEACNFLSDLSHRIMGDQEARRFSDVVSFGYWCRKANIKQKQAEFLGSRRDQVRVGRGLTLHIAPSNVPVNFAFSYVFALLAGNASIVRVPSKPFPQVKIILDAIDDTLEHHSSIAERTAFVSYPSSGSATEDLSMLADVRVIWGGDQTIETVRTCKSKPRSKDIVFSDRYSFALIDGGKFEAISDAEIDRLARGFYNDTYLMDQNACSSPHLIVWEHATSAGKERFWTAVRTIAEKDYRLQPSVVMDKYVKLCEDSISGTVRDRTDFDGTMTVVSLGAIPDSVEEVRGKGGYFYQIDGVEFGNLAACLTEKTQTLVYYGNEPHELKDKIVASGTLGIDRVVPVGSAMDIDVVWDGYDLVGEMSRIIDVR